MIFCCCFFTFYLLCFILNFSANRIDEYAEDPHYMEVLADFPAENPHTQHNNGVYKSHRAPPEAPQLTGRPK